MDKILNIIGLGIIIAYLSLIAVILFVLLNIFGVL